MQYQFSTILTLKQHWIFELWSFLISNVPEYFSQCFFKPTMIKWAEKSNFEGNQATILTMLINPQLLDSKDPEWNSRSKRIECGKIE